MAVDDTYTKSLLHFNGADASTTFPDESGKTWTVNGDAQLDTAQKKFGSASGLFDGTGDALTITNAEMAPGTGAFTLDFWIRHSAASTQVYYDSREAGAGNSGFILKLDADKKLIVFTSSAIKIQGTTVLVADTWYHVALVGNGGADGSRTLKAYLGGTQEGSTSTHDYSFSNTAARIGISQDGATPAFAGWMDEFRLSIGIARWTSNFTPPTKEYSSVEVYDIPYLTDTDTPVAPSINHVFPPYLTDTDTPMAPSINHVFPPALTDTDTAMAPVFNYAFKMSVYATDTDTTVAPYFGQLVPLTNPAIDSDIPFAPILSGVPAARHRVKVNLV